MSIFRARGVPYVVCPASTTTKVKVFGGVEAGREDVRGVLHTGVFTNESASAVNIDVHDSKLDAPANIIARIRIPANDTIPVLFNLEFKIGLQVVVPASARAVVTVL